MTTQRARRFAEQVHAGALDRYGVPLLEHVRRVAAAVPPKARTVAWLHEALECASVTPSDLLAAGATADEARAVRLLTRETISTDVHAYREHIARIAQAPGRAGELARIVKRADLRDRLDHQHSNSAPIVVRPPYLSALTLLTHAPDRGLPA